MLGWQKFLLVNCNLVELYHPPRLTLESRTMIADTEQEVDDLEIENEDDFKEQAVEAMKGIGLLEDEAENQFEDMFGY